MADAHRYPPKPSPGDAVAILSPSSQLASRFPAPLDLGLERLRAELGLTPVEYPTTRAAHASPAERARDIHAAFADRSIAGAFATIGGEDELKVLAHLDRELLAANPKPFFGYSDNTNLHLFLWNLGIVSYHGCAVMVELGRPGRVHPLTLESIRAAVFTSGPYVLEPPAEYRDEEGDWSEPRTLQTEPRMFPSDGWSWHGDGPAVSGRVWGGSLEIVDFHLRTGRYLPEEHLLDGAVLLLDTSEELPPAAYVYRVLMCMGERGLLARFAAVVWARPKAWSLEQRNDAERKRAYVDGQREAVLEAVREYNPDAPVVFGVDFGHTDPQFVIPSGGLISVDVAMRRIEVRY